MVRLVPQKLALITAALLAGVGSSCGGPGESDPKPCALCGEMNDLRGSISNQSGSQAQMQAWVVAILQRDGGIARVGEVDAAGLYTLSHVRTNYAQTLAILSPDYIVQGVLSMTGNAPNNIKQFLTIGSSNLPKLVHRGPIMTFQDLIGVKATNDLASDANGDGIPDGSVSLGAGKLGLVQAAEDAGFSLQGAAVDIDLDGTVNVKDPDIDGDGIVNWLDPDDNGNGILDVFDGDANGDLVNDREPAGQNTDLYFPEGVEWIAVQYQQRPREDGTGNQSMLNFSTKVRADVTPTAVQIRGAPSLLNGSTFIAKDAQGADTSVAWNRLLIDDGKSNDDNAGDRIFGQSVVLENGKAPRAHEMVFFQLAFGAKEAPWFMEFPYTFPDVKLAAVTAQYDTNTKTVLLVGNPFRDIQDFTWVINLYDSEGRRVWASQAIPGASRQFQIADNVMEAGKAYKFDVQATSLDKIPAKPSYTIYSIKYAIQ